ncbi:hypothetical protein SAMN06273572_101452 [Monaibacterium marinum]|uniref:Uncharacterized protein n=1 Tax=Pontivivens marinum TaxID=1690039 RepID=A0A2C9CMS1_9RHOB|nr:hypothetical protein [Monaibacterium marinum]SOH92604.1 hypothetical protein SAMN06273572_101452 [Monaibacterium marinum]
MIFASVSQFLAESGSLPGREPVAIIFVEDVSEVAATVSHHLRLGFVQVLLVGRLAVDAAIPDGEAITRIDEPVRSRDDAIAILNRLIDRLAGRWVYWGFNAEFLFYPYMESRKISDLTTFMTEERRDHVFGYSVDLYAADLDRAQDGVSRQNAHFDGSGYYGFHRYRDGQELDRQFDIFGGLTWRYEEFVPWERRRIDRVSLFRAIEGLRISDDLILSVPEMNTLSCPWHHNVTVAVASFRVAKSLKRNPGSMFEIETFMWRRSTPFEWRSEQLLELGIIEPGQWF